MRDRSSHKIKDFFSRKVARIFRRRDTAVHKLHGKQKPSSGRLTSSCQESQGGNAEPGVVFKVTIYDAKEDANKTRESTAVYPNDSPLEISVSPRKTDHLPGAEAGTVDVKRKPEVIRIGWDGRVLGATCETNAPFPSGAMDGDKKAAAGTKSPPLEIKYINSLRFERVSVASVVIKSPFLYRRLKALAGYYPSFYEIPCAHFDDPTTNRSEDVERPFSIREPWAFLLHRYPEMQAFVNGSNPYVSASKMGLDGTTNDTIRLEKDHVRYLCEFLKPLYETRILPYSKRLREPSPSFPFDMLWYVFAPGTDVYFRTGESTYQVCVVARVTSNTDDCFPTGLMRRPETKPQQWVLDLWYLESDGKKIGRVSTTCHINAYEGVKELTSLDVCLVSIWDNYDNGKRHSMIMERSKLLFKSLRQGNLLAHYDGPVVGATRYYSGKVVVDCRNGIIHSGQESPILGRVNDHTGRFRSYDSICVNAGDDIHEEPASEHRQSIDDDDISPLERDPWTSNATVGSSESLLAHSTHRVEETRDINPYPPLASANNPTTELTDHQLLLLFPCVRVFALKTKQWITIQPDNIIEITEGSDDSLENLALGAAELKILRALSTRQSSKRRTWAADFIEGKGRGQIILLHGPPGVGKTYTVEAISEFLNRPLLSLTAADIGTVETEVERELLRWFSLAEAWNAVLLVDDADIFLERRQSRDDITRNCLASAFLRHMEYFEGLLFLTTSRIGQLDDALISRVHVAIEYPAFSPVCNARICEQFFRRLAAGEPEPEEPEGERACGGGGGGGGGRVRTRSRARVRVSAEAQRRVLSRAKFGKPLLNGRDIRNALRTAVTLAEAAREEEDPDFDPDRTTVVVDESHFDRAFNISDKLRRYLASMRREDEGRRPAAGAAGAARLDRIGDWEAWSGRNGSI